MSKLSKVFAILTVVSSVIGLGFVFYALLSAFGFTRGSFEIRVLGILFGLSLAVVPSCISRSISELNHLSNLKFSHKD